MKRKYWFRIGAGLLLWTIVIGLFLIFYNPLGPQLQPITPAAPSVSFVPPGGVALPALTSTTTTVSQIPAINTAAPPEIAITPTATILPREVCGSAGAMTFVIVGESPYSSSAMLALNTIRLAKFDFGHKQIRVLSLPPDLMVDTPVLQTQGIGSTQLALVYADSKRGASGSENNKMGVAIKTLAQTLSDNFNYFPEHYIIVKPKSVTDMIDAVGGIDITLPVAVDGGSQGRGFYPSGQQHLEGDQVLDLMLILQSGDPKSSSDWGKYQLPTLVLQSVVTALDGPQNTIKIPSLVEVFRQAVLTDLSIKNILDLTCLVNDPGISLNVLTVGPDMTTLGNNQQKIPRVDMLSKFISDNVGK